MREPDRSDNFKVYAVGRPLLFFVWALALWGTCTGVRLVWMALTGRMTAVLRLGTHAFVRVPIMAAVVMWTALALAWRQHKRGGEA
jgi:hypothetical protein